MFEAISVSRPPLGDRSYHLSLKSNSASADQHFFFNHKGENERQRPAEEQSYIQGLRKVVLPQLHDHVILT
jgi:hypothetical protein